MEQNSIESKKNIYLPAFKIQRNTYFTHPKSFGDIILQNEGKNFQIEKFNQINEMCLNHDQIGGIVNISPDERNDVVIKSDFLVAIINLEILSDFQIPVISAFIVRKNDFITCSH